MSIIKLTKQQLRELIYNKRHEMNTEDKTKWDTSILNGILNSDFYESAQVIFTYVSFQGEVDTIKFIETALSQGKTICVPRVISKAEGMEAHKITSLAELEKSSYGILEPKQDNQIINPEHIDLLIMPGVAFDKNNGRIGYGGGFYDRYMKKTNPKAHKIALAYGFQILEEIPTDEFDEKVDFIITNESVPYE